MAKLSTKDRNKLDDSDFGIPEKRMYPLNDKAHVESAVRLFGHASNKDKPKLARRILAKANEYGMDTSGWEEIHKWAKKESSDDKTTKESYVVDPLISRIIQESTENEIEPVSDFKYDKVYFGTPSKLSEIKLDKPLFVTPFKGLASIFAIRDYARKGLREQGIYSYNMDYDEWKLPESKINKVFDEIHIRIAEDSGKKFESFSGEAVGYIYTIDVSDIKDHIGRYKWMDKNREFLIYGLQSLPIETFEEVRLGFIVTPDKGVSIQEGAFQDIKNGVNPYSSKLFFHISRDSKLAEKTLEPRIPTYLVKDKDQVQTNEELGLHEDATTPRVCFSPSIEGCLNAIINHGDRLALAGEAFYVYIPTKPIDQYKHKTNKEIIRDKDVFDAPSTKEMWILEPVDVKLYGVIVVDQVSRKKKERIADKKTGNWVWHYTYKWHWQNKPSTIEESYVIYPISGIFQEFTDGTHIEYGYGANEKSFPITCPNNPSIKQRIMLELMDVDIQRLLADDVIAPYCKQKGYDKEAEAALLKAYNDSIPPEYQDYRAKDAWDIINGFDHPSEGYLALYPPSKAELTSDNTAFMIFDSSCKNPSNHIRVDLELEDNGELFAQIVSPDKQQRIKLAKYNLSDFTEYIGEKDQHKLFEKACYDKIKSLIPDEIKQYVEKLKEDQYFKYTDSDKKLPKGLWIFGGLDRVVSITVFNELLQNNAFMQFDRNGDWDKKLETLPKINPEYILIGMDEYYGDNFIEYHIPTGRVVQTLGRFTDIPKDIEEDFGELGSSWKDFLSKIKKSSFGSGSSAAYGLKSKNKKFKRHIQESYKIFKEGDEEEVKETEDIKVGDLDLKEEKTTETENDETYTADDVDLGKFGTDTSSVQNEYDPKEIEILMKLMASEADAMNEYMDGAKETNVDVLRRLYADIANEERFHMEQLLFAKSEITGEKYEPKDPDVKKEYEELLEMGMDEETAMQTAVDKCHIRGSISFEEKDDVMSDDEAMETIEDIQVAEMAIHGFISKFDNLISVMESECSETDLDNAIHAFSESFVFMEGANTPNQQDLQGNWQKGPSGIIGVLQKTIQFVLRMFGQIIRKFGNLIQWIRSKMKKYKTIRDVNGHTWKALFKDGVSFYLINPKIQLTPQNNYGIDPAAVVYMVLVQRLAYMANQKIKSGVNMNELDNTVMNEMSPSEQAMWKKLQFNNIDTGIRIIEHTNLERIKYIIDPAVENALNGMFFGYNQNAAIDVNGEIVSLNIYNKFRKLQSFWEKILKNMDTILTHAKSVKDDQTNSNEYRSGIDGIKVCVKGAKAFVSALGSDIAEMTKINQALIDETKAKDAARAAGNPPQQ